jgi:hypothetical protein
MANSYPPWSRARQLAQSTCQQILAPVGEEFEDVYWWTNYDLGNYILTTTDPNELGDLFRLVLPSTFSFQTKGSSNLTTYLTPTSVRGQLSSGTWLDLAQAEDNSLEEFWCAPPDRILANGESYSYSPVLPLTQVSDLVNATPFALPFSTRLWVTVSEIGRSIKNYKGIVLRARIEIAGYDLSGLEVIESIIFAFDGSIQTNTCWSEITSIQTHYIDDTAYVRVDWLNHEQSNFIDYSGLYVTTTREKFRFYAHSLSDGDSYLEHKTFSAPDLITVQDGDPSKQTMCKMELLDPDGDNVSGLGMALWPRRRWVVINNEDTLYFFQPAISLPDVSPLIERSPEPVLQVYIENEYVVKGDTITLDYNVTKPLFRILKTRWSVLKPDGTRVGIAPDGTEITYSYSGWEENQNGTRFRKVGYQAEGIEYTLSDRGRYVFYLESYIADDLSNTPIYQEQVDVRVIQASSEVAKTSITLPASVGDVAHIGFDSYGRPWVVNSNSMAYLLDFHYDKYLVDFTNKVLYFREEYSSVEVEA